MWHRLIEWLIGCPRCLERQERIAALTSQNADLLNRLMSRDYASHAFVKANTETLETKTGDGEEAVGDGLD
jgi:hypothetical protein